MKYLRHISRSKGIGEIPRRALLILNRFGLTERGFNRFLSETMGLAGHYRFRPTFFVTAILMERYPNVLHLLQNASCDIAVHGYIHTDYRQLSFEQQAEHFKKARTLFSNPKTQGIGFRAPYLSWNRDTILSARNNAYDWSSNQPVIWDDIRLPESEQSLIDNFHRVLMTLYKPKSASDTPIIPYLYGGMLELPISLPDDEILIDRLRISDPEKLFEVWRELLVKTYQGGDLYTLLLHPERSPIYFPALRSLVVEAKEKKPAVWIAGLQEVADWWREKSNFSMTIHPVDSTGYEIHTSCTERATLLVNHLPVSVEPPPAVPFDNGYFEITNRRFILKSKVKPLIGISTDTSQETREFLKNEGYPFEVRRNDNNYALTIDAEDSFSADRSKALLEKIEKCTAPLVRFWRWPSGYKSALSITYDVDSITFQDFLFRTLEF